MKPRPRELLGCVLLREDDDRAEVTLTLTGPAVEASEDGFASVMLASDAITVAVVSGPAGPGGQR